MLQGPVSSTFYTSVSYLRNSSEAVLACSGGDIVVGKLKVLMPSGTTLEQQEMGLN